MPAHAQRSALTLLLLSGCRAGAPTTGAALLDGGVSDGSARAMDAGDTGDLPRLTAFFDDKKGTAVVGVLTVSSSSAGLDSVRVRYGNAIDGDTDTPAFALVGGTTDVPLLGLRPGVEHHAQAAGFLGAAAITQSATVTMTPGPLPAWTYPLDTKASGANAGGYVLLGLAAASDQRAMAMMVDRAGRILWYSDYGGLWPTGTDFQRQIDGRFTLIDPKTMELAELDLLGNVVAPLVDTVAPGGADPHDVLILPSGNRVFIGRDSAIRDCTGYLPDSAATLVEQCTIDELAADGTPVFHWASANEIGLDETAPDIWAQSSTEAPVDALHPNSITVTPAGDYLLSLRNTDTVVLVSRQTGAISWRLGGVHSDFRFIGDPLGGFSHQHFARITRAETLLLFDDGNLHSPPLSRAVEYQVDEINRTATLLWEARYPENTFDLFGGSAERLDNGNTLVAWATTPSVTEMTPSGQVVWELRAPPGTMIYRALYVASLYP